MVSPTKSVHTCTHGTLEAVAPEPALLTTEPAQLTPWGGRPREQREALKNRDGEIRRSSPKVMTFHQFKTRFCSLVHPCPGGTAWGRGDAAGSPAPWKGTWPRWWETGPGVEVGWQRGGKRGRSARSSLRVKATVSAPCVFVLCLPPNPSCPGAGPSPPVKGGLRPAGPNWPRSS